MCCGEANLAGLAGGAKRGLLQAGALAFVGLVDGQGHSEGGALAQHRGHVDGAVVGGHQAVDDAQAQASATIPARGGGVPLRHTSALSACQLA